MPQNLDIYPYTLHWHHLSYFKVMIGFLFLDMHWALHFLLLNDISEVEDHASTLFKSCCRTEFGAVGVYSYYLRCAINLVRRHGKKLVTVLMFFFWICYQFIFNLYLSLFTKRIHTFYPCC
jgi:hypothetical protein